MKVCAIPNNANPYQTRYGKINNKQNTSFGQITNIPELKGRMMKEVRAGKATKAQVDDVINRLGQIRFDFRTTYDEAAKNDPIRKYLDYSRTDRLAYNFYIPAYKRQGMNDSDLPFKLTDYFVLPGDDFDKLVEDHYLNRSLCSCLFSGNRLITGMYLTKDHALRCDSNKQDFVLTETEPEHVHKFAGFYDYNKTLTELLTNMLDNDSIKKAFSDYVKYIQGQLSLLEQWTSVDNETLKVGNYHLQYNYPLPE